MHTQIDQRLTRHGATAMALLLVTMILAACPPKGGGGGGDQGTRDALRAERGSTSDGAYRQKWGLPKK